MSIEPRILCRAFRQYRDYFGKIGLNQPEAFAAARDAADQLRKAGRRCPAAKIVLSEGQLDAIAAQHGNPAARARHMLTAKGVHSRERLSALAECIAQGAPASVRLSIAIGDVQ